MLVELRVSQLGVIDDVAVILGDGMTALTGETGAGKTLIVDAIQLLVGGSSDPTLVRPGAAEAIVEGRFLDPGTAAPTPEEIVLTRVIPSTGRSRSYVDGRMVSASQLGEIGSAVVDLHGQHSQQSLLSPAAQRAALDLAASIDTTAVVEARRRVREIRNEQAALGGDARSRARELDLLRYQLGEIDAAKLEDPQEDDALREEEDVLSDASGLRETAGAAWEALAGDGGVVDSLGQVVPLVSGRSALSSLLSRMQSLEAELADVAAEARRVAEETEDDPERLSWIGTRRQTLTDLRRKYGDTLDEVIGFREELRRRVTEIESHDERAAALERELTEAERLQSVAETELWQARREAAPVLAAVVEQRLQELAMPNARFEVVVGEEPESESVTWKLGANVGESVLPLTKVASGGELARTMLAARLAVGPVADPDNGRRTLIFDEVDAGVGGEAAVAVGQALAQLGANHQVLVVTHLPQVAAFADHHLVVRKQVRDDRTFAEVQAVDGDERVVELSRMLSGSPDSETAKRHAEELLARVRGRGSHRRRVPLG